MTILVTGGAGYIGSHVVDCLEKSGADYLVFDNLSTGFAWAVPDGKLVAGDLANHAVVSQLFVDHEIESVIHFAASVVVPESVENPAKYYRNNTGNTLQLIDLAAQHGVKHFIFSSTAAVYGELAEAAISEQMPTSPINPYGWSKLHSEQCLRDISSASGLRFVILRYFNVAGAHPDGHIGQATANATHLIKVAAELATGVREQINIFGTDYATPDGTCIRDYIHVMDLADAHIRALDYLMDGGASETFNCGYGRGFSVREVLAAMQALVDKPLNIVEASRRAGDPPALIAAVDKIKRTLGWTPKYDDLQVIAKHALAWQVTHNQK